MSNLNMAQNEESVDKDTYSSLISSIITEIIYSPLNLGLFVVCLYLLYKIFANRKVDDFQETPRTPGLPPLKKHDMTYEELKKYDGHNEDGRVCVAVNGKVFDVTRGKQHYGPGGAYASFAGRDASRCLAKFSIVGASDEFDDLSDLNSMEMDTVREWEAQFQEKYHYVGRLLKPGEEPTDYSDDEEASQDQSTQEDQSSPSSSKKDE